MAARKVPTKKELGFIRDSIRLKNDREAIMRNYNTVSPLNASQMAIKIKKRPHVKVLLEDAAKAAFEDQIMLRDTLKNDDKEAAVRSRINMDLMDRGGLKPQQVTNLTQINVYTEDQQKRFAERILRNRKAEGEGSSS